MTTFVIELPEPVAEEAERQARSQGKSLPSFLGELVRERLQPASRWPDRFFETVVGGWRGDPLVRPEPAPLEERDSL